MQVHARILKHSLAFVRKGNQTIRRRLADNVGVAMQTGFLERAENALAVRTRYLQHRAKFPR